MPTKFHPVTVAAVGNPEAGYGIEYYLGEAYPTATEASREHMRAVEHDDFLIAEVDDRGDDRALVDLLTADLKPLTDWGQVSYRDAAESLCMEWQPKPGTHGATAPEEDLCPFCVEARRPVQDAAGGAQ